jgi:hypothetical protein
MVANAIRFNMLLISPQILFIAVTIVTAFMNQLLDTYNIY